MVVSQTVATIGSRRIKRSPLVFEGVPRRINLALQGGGSHGAFTWGVLNRLLDADAVSYTHLTLPTILLV